MATTIKGGIFKDATGEGYHDCNGNPVSPEGVSLEAQAQESAASAAENLRLENESLKAQLAEALKKQPKS